MSMPMQFPGTPEEVAANHASHLFLFSGDPDDGDCRCAHCDSRPWGISADWPCGADIPRTDTSEGDFIAWAARFPVWAALVKAGT